MAKVIQKFLRDCIIKRQAMENLVNFSLELALSVKRFEIRPQLLLNMNRKSSTTFQLVPKIKKKDDLG